jgi:hypothetical protein
MELTTSSKHHLDKPQIRTKKDMPNMQIFELSPNDTIKLLTREPLLIVWLPILKPGLPNTMRPERKKPYQDHTFALRNPLELDNDDLDLLKLHHLS